MSGRRVELAEVSEIFLVFLLRFSIWFLEFAALGQIILRIGIVILLVSRPKSDVSQTI